MKKVFIFLFAALSLQLTAFSQNLGINHLTPQYPLSFPAVVGNKISLFGDAGPHYGFGIQNHLLQIHTDLLDSDIAFGYGSSSAFTETMRIKGNGFVGIGTNSPNAPLGFAAWLGKKITLYPGAIGDAGFGIWGNELRIASDHSGADITLGTDDRANGFTERMRMKGNGNVGIGTNNPLAKLHVNNSVLFTRDNTGAPPAEVPGANTGGSRMFWYADKSAFRVGYFNEPSWDKDAIGYNSFAAGANSHASGDVAIAMGYVARATGISSLCIGHRSHAGGDYSIALGTESRAGGYGGVALGFEANASGRYSTAVGLFSSATGENSMALGLHADARGRMSTAMGANNIAKAFASFVVGDCNDLSDNPDPTVANPLDRIFQIGNGSNSNQRSNAMTVLRNGNVGIGTTNPQSALHIGNSGALKISDASGTKYGLLYHSNYNLHVDAIGGGYTYFNWYGGSGLIVGNGSGFGYGPVNASAFVVSSSERFKKDITNSRYGLAQILQLQGKEYNYINDNSHKNEIGLIAEEVIKLIPEVVYHNAADNKLMGIDYSKLNVVLIEAIKEQQQQIDELKKMVEKLMAK